MFAHQFRRLRVEGGNPRPARRRRQRRGRRVAAVEGRPVRYSLRGVYLAIPCPRQRFPRLEGEGFELFGVVVHREAPRAVDRSSSAGEPSAEGPATPRSARWRLRGAWRGGTLTRNHGRGLLRRRVGPPTLRIPVTITFTFLQREARARRAARRLDLVVAKLRDQRYVRAARSQGPGSPGDHRGRQLRARS